MINIAFPVRKSTRREFNLESNLQGIEIYTDKRIEGEGSLFLGSNDFYGNLMNRYFISAASSDIEHILEASGINDVISRKLLSEFKVEKKGIEDFKSPMIMAAVNATPDSFYSGSRLDNQNTLIDSIMDAKPDIIDIGGESTRPGSMELSAGDEIKRVEPVLEHVVSASNIPISLDTRHPEVLEYFADRVHYANDISGFRDDHMVKIAADHSLKCITMHMRGTPSNMQSLTEYVEVFPEVLSYLWESAQKLEAAGISSNDIIIDPGIGFSKDINGNLALLSEIESFKIGYKTLVGASRKSFIGKITGEKEEGRLAGTLAVTAYLALKCVDIIRVHDPKENIELIKVLRSVEEGKF